MSIESFPKTKMEVHRNERGLTLNMLYETLKEFVDLQSRYNSNLDLISKEERKLRVKSGESKVAIKVGMDMASVACNANASSYAYEIYSMMKLKDAITLDPEEIYMMITKLSKRCFVVDSDDRIKDGFKGELKDEMIKNATYEIYYGIAIETEE